MIIFLHCLLLVHFMFATTSSWIGFWKVPYPKAKQRERGRREKHTYTHITPLHSVSDGKKNQQLFRNGFEPSRDAEKKNNSAWETGPAKWKMRNKRQNKKRIHTKSILYNYKYRDVCYIHTVHNSLFHILYAPSSSIFIRLYSLVLSISFTPSLHSRNICPWCFGCFVFHVDGRQLNWKLEQPTMTVGETKLERMNKMQQQQNPEEEIAQAITHWSEKWCGDCCCASHLRIQ